MADIKYLITVDSQGAIKSMKDFEGAITGGADAATKAETPHASLWKQVAIGELAVKALTKVWGIAVTQVKESIGAALEAEKAEKGLESAISLTGRTLGYMLPRLNDYADALAQKTLYTDEEIRQAETLLVQLTKLDANGIQRATRGAAGLATVMGTDLQSATMMVTKAMEGNYQALQRVGIKVDENLPPQERQAELLSKLETLYGRAEAAVDTYSGKLTQANKYIDEAKESIGRLILEKTGFVNMYNDMAKALYDFLTLSDREGKILQENTKASIQLDNAMWKALSTSRERIDIYTQLQAKYGPNAAGMLAEINTNVRYASVVGVVNQAIMELAISEKAAEDAINQTGAASTKAIPKITLLATETGKFFQPFKRDRIADIKALYEALGTSITQTALPAQRDLTQSVIDFGFKSAEIAARVPKDWGKATQAWAVNFQKTMNDISMFAGMFFSQLTEISNQYQKNENINLDNQYKKRREVIDKSTKDEKTKAALIIALDSEFEQKRRAVANKAAQAQKAMSIVQAVINTAEGMTKALAQGGILGPILAAVVAAFGAIQISLIKSQPIPMAKGGILSKPTFSGDYVAGEAGGEGVVPLTPTQARRAASALAGESSGRPIAITIPIYVGGKKVDEYIIDLVQDAADTNRIKIKSRAVN